VSDLNWLDSHFTKMNSNVGIVSGATFEQLEPVAVLCPEKWELGQHVGADVMAP
jgi:hypothetical protein